MNIRVLILFTFIFIPFTLPSAASSYKSWPEITGPYLGQTPPGMTSEIFAPDIISTAISEINSAFTPEGNEFYFTTWTKETGTRIMFTRQIGERWTAPEVSSFSKGFGEVDPAFSVDGKKVFYGSKRPRPGEIEMRKDGFDIWFAERTESGWSEEQFLAPVVNSGKHQIYATATRDGTLYFQAKRKQGYGKADIYRSRLLEGVYQTPENLGPIINSENYEGDVFIAPNESYLIVSISGRKDSFGGADLYISFAKNGSWTPLKNMGSAVNSSKRDFCPMVSPDGKYFFFTSKRLGESDIFWIDAKIIKSLKKLK